MDNQDPNKIVPTDSAVPEQNSAIETEPVTTVAEQPAEQPTEQFSEQPAEQPAPVTAEVSETPSAKKTPVKPAKKTKLPKAASAKPKHKLKLPVIIAICVAAILVIGAAVVFVLFKNSYGNYVINKPKTKVADRDIPQDWIAYSDSNPDYSFAYPWFATIDEGKDGITLYLDPENPEERPYIVINYNDDKSVNPWLYMNSFKSDLKGDYDSVSAGEVSSAEAGKKTVYIMRSKIKDKKDTFYVDCILEIYEDSYVVYTVYTDGKADVDSLVVDVIKTFCLADDVFDDYMETMTTTEATEPAETDDADTPSESDPTETDETFRTDSGRS